MTTLSLHGKSVSTVFALLGQKENDITYSLGWGLAQCDGFLTALLRSVLENREVGQPQSIALQQHGTDGGFTDIEILTEKVHLIIEAKCGWNLPTPAQLTRYKSRFSKTDDRPALLVLSECSPEYAGERLPKTIRNVPVLHRSWRELHEMANQSAQRGSHAAKRLLWEFCQYLEELMTMQNHDSNRVFIVVLSDDVPSWSRLSWREHVTLRHRYFHPIRNGWPKEPPNYMGFRYKGKLQSIHHVDTYEVVADLSKHLRDIDAGWRKGRIGENYFLYGLGPPIVPQRDVRNGSMWTNGRCWAALDLLLTARTVADAVKKTKRRGEE
jgi:hypothetical protein